MEAPCGSPGTALHLAAPGIYRDGIPHAVYDRIRTDHAVHHDGGATPFYAVLTHAEAARVLQDTAHFSSALKGILIEDVSEQMRPVMRAMLPFTDAPSHTELRRKLAAPLLAGHLAGLKARLGCACEALIRAALADGEVEFVHRLAAEVPLTAFGLLTGLERGELEPLREPSDAVIENGLNGSSVAIAQLCQHLDELVGRRLREPRDDYMTWLAQVDFAERPMSSLERNGMLLQMVIGALETARNTIAGFLVALSENPAQWHALRGDRTLVGNAVEESLRFVSPVNYLRRTTVTAVDLRGVSLPPGARVVVFLSAANRDPARFVRPHELSLGRTNARQHLALGAGAHFCMGAALARMQLTAFWSAFGAAVADFELTGPCERGGLVQQNLIKRLPVRLQAA